MSLSLHFFQYCLEMVFIFTGSTRMMLWCSTILESLWIRTLLTASHYLLAKWLLMLLLLLRLLNLFIVIVFLLRRGCTKEDDKRWFLTQNYVFRFFQEKVNLNSAVAKHNQHRPSSVKLLSSVCFCPPLFLGQSEQSLSAGQHPWPWLPC